MTINIRWIGVCGAVMMLLFAIAVPAEAKSVVRTGDSVSIGEEQLIEGDFYAAGGKINISGEIEEDMVAAGGQVTINGTVGDNALFFAAQANVHGTIGDDLRIVGGEVTIAEPVVGDVFVIADTVTILSTASVGGDVILYSSKATIEGAVGGDVLGTVNTLRVDGVVTGDVDVVVGELTLGDKALVEGSVMYVSNQLLVQALNATVAGDTLRNDPILPGSSATLRNVLIPVLMLFFSALSWYLISRQTMSLVVSRALTRSPRQPLLGFFFILFAPAAIAILLVSMIGTFVGLIGLLAYVLIIMTAAIGVAAVIGQLLMKAFNQPLADLSLWSLFIGVTAVGALTLLPYLGQFILIGFLIITVGAIVDVIIRPQAR